MSLVAPGGAVLLELEAESADECSRWVRIVNLTHESHSLLEEEKP